MILDKENFDKNFFHNMVFPRGWCSLGRLDFKAVLYKKLTGTQLLESVKSGVPIFPGHPRAKRKVPGATQHC